MFRKNLSREPDFCNHGQSPTKETQGRPQLRLQKSYLFQVPKTNPKLAPCACLSWSWHFFFESGTADVALRLGSEIGPSLSWSWQSFSFCSVDERGPVFPKPAIEARRGLAEARLVSPKHKITVNCTVFFDRRPVPFGGSRCIETYSSTMSRSRPRTRGESIRG